MPYPRKKLSNEKSILPPEFTLTPSQLEEKRLKEEIYKGQKFEEVVASMADEKKVDIARSIIQQITETGDPSATKLLQSILEKQGYSTEKELPISDERYYEIIKVFSRLFVS